ncbi:hypothetical protein K439DRAFT_1610220 [Ramaria rubella]|nr:hypothetical protein K439DRAFT_1610220 [Ramaria rubella]
MLSIKAPSLLHMGQNLILQVDVSVAVVFFAHATINIYTINFKGNSTNMVTWMFTNPNSNLEIFNSQFNLRNHPGTHFFLIPTVPPGGSEENTLPASLSIAENDGNWYQQQMLGDDWTIMSTFAYLHLFAWFSQPKPQHR